MRRETDALSILVGFIGYNIAMKIEKFDESALKSSDDMTISFDEGMASDEICDTIVKILVCEAENDVHYRFLLKGLGPEKVSAVLRTAMKLENLENPSILLNVILLLKTYNSLNDSFFGDENVWFGSLEDFLDVKCELKMDIKAFNTVLAVYFISCLKSLGKFEYSFIDNPVDIPDTFKNILTSIDIFTVSGILSNNNGYTDKDMKLIRNAYAYVSEIIAKMNMVDRMFGMLNSTDVQQVGES